MTAEDLFKELGYKKTRDDEKYIVYHIEDGNNNSIYEIQISI